MSILNKEGLGINKILAFLAIGLGVLSLAGTTNSGSTVSVDLSELALIVENEADHITVQDLADRIIQGSTDYRLIDIRSAEEYASYHIPGAENVPLSQLPDYPLLKNEELILYSKGGIHSAQAWVLMRAKGFKGSFMLLGGLNAWEDFVLFPLLADGATPDEVAAFSKIQEISEYFGGSPVIGGAAIGGEETKTMPLVVTPTQPVITTRRRAAREGC